MEPLSRRQLIKLGFGAAAALSMPRAAFAAAPVRKLSFYHMHTGETLNVAYFEKGKYIPGALHEMNTILRDWRTGDVQAIDPALFDQLYALQRMVDTPGAYHVICGYRSPKTNQTLHARSDGVASHSLHLEGRAIDINLPGRGLAQLHKAALSMRAGGVGYYPSSDFIHLDTGRIRRWG